MKLEFCLIFEGFNHSMKRIIWNFLWIIIRFENRRIVLTLNWRIWRHRTFSTWLILLPVIKFLRIVPLFTQILCGNSTFTAGTSCENFFTNLTLNLCVVKLTELSLNETKGQMPMPIHYEAQIDENILNKLKTSHHNRKANKFELS